VEAVKDSIAISAHAEIVYNTLIRTFSSENNYRAWHGSHVTCRWIKGKPFEKGSVLYAEEMLHGKPHKMKFMVTKNELNKCLEMKVLFPVSLVCPRGGFTVEPSSGGAIFTAVLYFRFTRLFRKFAGGRVRDIMAHMKEEGEGLKRIIESP